MVEDAEGRGRPSRKASRSAWAWVLRRSVGEEGTVVRWGGCWKSPLKRSLWSPIEERTWLGSWSCLRRRELEGDLGEVREGGEVGFLVGSEVDLPDFLIGGEVDFPAESLVGLMVEASGEVTAEGS